MLLKLILRYSKPYKGWIVAVLFFQLATTIATLYLPSLNARIIDKGVSRATPTSSGVPAASCSLSPSCRSSLPSPAVYFGAKTAMAIGRDLRRAVFDRKVTSFSAQDVNRSAPQR